MSLAAITWHLIRHDMAETSRLALETDSRRVAAFAGYSKESAQEYNGFMGRLRQIFAPKQATAPRITAPSEALRLLAGLGIPSSN